jgi:integrase
MGAGRRPLTKRAIDAARHDGARTAQMIVWDGDVTGFGLRAYPSGAKSFVLFYRNADGRKRLHVIGGYPEITLDEARRQAKLRLAEVLRGGDPSADRRERRQAVTFGDLAGAYLEKHARLHKRSVRDDEQRIRDFLGPAWGPRKASTISRGDVAALHRRIAQKREAKRQGERTRGGPYAANRTLALVSHVFAWGEAEGLLPKAHPNPARGVRPLRETSRERWLSPAEVKGLLEALAAEPNVYVRAFFWVSLMTGCRKSELLGARWVDVDLEAGILRLPRTKAGRAHHVPLAGPARAVLAALPREAGNPHVFPGSRRGAALVNVEKTWRRIREAAGCPDARLHDLRRTVGSWMAQHGASLPLIGSVLGHSNQTTTAVYARLAEEGRRVALEAHAQRIVDVAGVPAVSP